MSQEGTNPIMSLKRLVPFVGFSLIFSAALQAGAEKNLRITIPLHSELTPVQRLNREGVNAILKHHFEDAEGQFYKAYLYDPTDPFTLNNLGYVSELQGQVDRAEKFYKLAEEQGCFAAIDRSSAKRLDGKPMMDALTGLRSVPMRVNRINLLSMQLLAQDHPFEADALLKKALELDPHSAFTLNNLGVADEAAGDLDSALKYYDEAAAAHSTEPVVVTLNRSWRGKPVSEMAADSATNLRKRLQNMSPNQIRATMLTVRGVAASNRQDWTEARRDFVEAYALDPQSAFAINNLGYVKERDGDFETAKSYYARARNADDAHAKVGLATQSSAQGQPLADIADNSHRGMDLQLNSYTEEHRGQKNSFELKRRNVPSDTPGTAPKDKTAQPSADSSTNKPTADSSTEPTPQ